MGYPSIFRSSLLNKLLFFNFKIFAFLLIISYFFASNNVLGFFLSEFEPEKTGGSTRRERGKKVHGRWGGRKRKRVQSYDDMVGDDGDHGNGDVLRGIPCTAVP